MAKIIVEPDYNWWLILKNAGIDPTIDIEKYNFNGKTGELEINCTQEKLDKALADYDHQEWLKELKQIKNIKPKEEDLGERINELELFILTKEGLI